MAICNTFKKISNENGTFFSFSQYAEDLTKHQSNNSYKIIPSKFICFNVDYSNYDNETLPLLLQNNFENGYSFIKNQVQDWSPEISRSLFWSSTRSLFSKDDIISVVYIGDINIQSYSLKDNIGYNEIYCYIPNDAKKIILENAYIDKSNEIFEYDRDFIMGYDENDKYFNGLLSIDKILNDNALVDIKGYNYKYDKDLTLDNIKIDDTAKSFEFNTVVILYDIYINDNILYTNIPLGMYITGVINNGVMENPVKKFVSNDDIFGSGTSYGLRICNRFIISPNGTQIKTEYNSLEDEDRIYESLTQAMTAMVESQYKMDEVVESIHAYHKDIKDHLSIFKNNKVNVPYIRYVDLKPYWFVNGKNTGYSAQGELGHIFNIYADSLVEGTSEKFGALNSANGKRSHAEGAGVQAIGDYSHAEGLNNKSIGEASHVEGTQNESIGLYSSSKGLNNKSIGEASHVEGYLNEAIGNYSHAEGMKNKTTGDISHAEGYLNEARGVGSHAEGYNNITESNYSHAEGEGNITKNIAQFVGGRYAMIDHDNKKIFQIGIGEETKRANALSINYDGTIEIGGDTETDPVILNKEDFNNLVNLDDKILDILDDYNFDIEIPEIPEYPDYTDKFNEIDENFENITKVSTDNVENLNLLKESIFDPDGELTHNFVNTMMSQVGSDSMNYQLKYTKYALDKDGDKILQNMEISNSHFKVVLDDILVHFVYNTGSQSGEWNIKGSFDSILESGNTYYICLKCNRNSNEGEWVCDTIQHKTEEDESYWYFNYGILVYDSDNNYNLMETRGCSYMYGDNLVCGKISSLAENSYFDLTNGDFVLGANTEKPALSYIDGVLTIGGVEDDSVDKVMEDLGLLQSRVEDIENNGAKIDPTQLAEITSSISNLQSQIDGEVNSWFYEGAPSLDKIPTSNWDVEDYAKHEGDTYTDITTFIDNESTPTAGQSWRWCNVDDEYGTGWHWHKIADSDAVKALSEAGKAVAAVDGKCTTFTNKPTKYSIGDLWILQNDTDHSSGKKGQILISIANNEEYNSADWVNQISYTDDTVANAAKQEADEAKQTAENAQVNADRAISQLDAIDDDNLISKTEIPSLKLQLNDIIAEYNEIIVDAERYNIDREEYEQAYQNAISSLNYHIDPSNYDGNGNIEIIIDENSEYYYGNIESYYTYRQTILDNISIVAKEVADNAAAVAEEAKTTSDEAKTTAEEANNAAKIAAADAAATNYLREALTDGSTDITGGLVMTNVLMLKDQNGNVTAGISGLTQSADKNTPDNVLLWGGCTYNDAFVAAQNDYKDANGNLVNTLFKKDGTGKIGVFEVDSESAIVNDKLGNEKVVIKNSNINTEPILENCHKIYTEQQDTEVYQEQTTGEKFNDDIIINKRILSNFNSSSENYNNESYNYLSYITGKINLNNLIFYGASYDNFNSEIQYGLLLDNIFIPFGKINRDNCDPAESEAVKFIGSDGNGILEMNIQIDLSQYNIEKSRSNDFSFAFISNTEKEAAISYKINTMSFKCVCSTNKILIGSDGLIINNDGGSQFKMTSSFGNSNIIVNGLPLADKVGNDTGLLYISNNDQGIKSSYKNAFNHLQYIAGNFDKLLIQFTHLLNYNCELLTSLDNYLNNENETTKSDLKTKISNLKGCMSNGTYTYDGELFYGLLHERESGMDEYEVPLCDLKSDSDGRSPKKYLQTLQKDSNNIVKDNSRLLCIK